MATYKDLILQHCAEIVNQVLEGMEKNRFRVGTKPILVPKEPVLYRWWFHSESEVVKLLRAWKSKDSKKPINLLDGVLTKKFPDGETYYALYFGKSNKGYRRFIQHSKGNIHTSTLRRTIHSLLTDEEYNKPVHEKQIDEILKDCYFEWAVIDKEEESLVECIEAICIVHGTYPLNIDGNPAINSKWREYMMNERGKVKDKK